MNISPIAGGSEKYMQKHEGAVNNEVVEDATATESAAVETQSSEENQEGDYKVVIADDGEVKRVKVETESGEDEEKDPTETDKSETPKKGAEARKEQLSGDINQESEEIRALVSEKNRLMAERASMQEEIASLQQRQQAAAIPTVEQIMQQENPNTGDFFTQFEAEAIRENLQLRQQLVTVEQQRVENEQNTRIAESVNGLRSDAEKALGDFPVFDSNSPEYIPELAAKADEILQNALIHDQKRGVIGSKISVYNLYKTIFDAAKPGIEAEKIKRQQGAVSAQAGADVIGSGMRQSTKKFDDLSTNEMEARLRKRGLIQ